MRNKRTNTFVKTRNALKISCELMRKKNQFRSLLHLSRYARNHEGRSHFSSGKNNTEQLIKIKYPTCYAILILRFRKTCAIFAKRKIPRFYRVRIQCAKIYAMFIAARSLYLLNETKFYLNS